MALARKSGAVESGRPSFSYPYPEGHFWGMVLDELQDKFAQRPLPHYVDDWIGRGRYTPPDPYVGIYHGPNPPPPDVWPRRLYRLVTFLDVFFPAILNRPFPQWQLGGGKAGRPFSVGGDGHKDLGAFPDAFHLHPWGGVFRLPVTVPPGCLLAAWFDRPFAYDQALILAVRQAVPILTNRTPETRRYLGQDYPLFLSRADLRPLDSDVESAHQYLTALQPYRTSASLVDCLSQACEGPPA